jgi:hypothetical protein
MKTMYRVSSIYQTMAPSIRRVEVIDETAASVRFVGRDGKPQSERKESEHIYWAESFPDAKLRARCIASERERKSLENYCNQKAAKAKVESMTELGCVDGWGRF